MICPFLKEEHVRYCRASPFKKMIPRSLEDTHSQRCSGREWVSCPMAMQKDQEMADQMQCPYLQESLVQYCSAASATKFIPYSESLLSRCGNEGHRYCELYLAMANPESNANDAASNGRQKDMAVEFWVEGVRLPSRLWYSPNHMWLDVSDDGYCHVGVDGFLTKVLGQVDQISFVEGKGIKRPSVVLTSNGVDFHLVFPNRLMIAGRNAYLRACPQKLISDPYVTGWLFEGIEPSATVLDSNESITTGLINGKDAYEWMQQESLRLSVWLHHVIGLSQSRGEIVMMDGGSFHQGVVQHLKREQTLHLFDEFFSPFSTDKRPK